MKQWKFNTPCQLQKEDQSTSYNTLTEKADLLEPISALRDIMVPCMCVSSATQSPFQVKKNENENECALIQLEILKEIINRSKKVDF